MELEVESISQVIVQPSSPTPDRLRHYQLSFLDQITPSVYNPLVLFYPQICNTEANKIETINQLKHSISDALTHFYPLAGRIQDNLFVDCNDQGIPFVEARVKCQLSDVISNPVPIELNKLCPFDLYDATGPILGVQFNVFNCGGIGIGLCISHKIGDALSLFIFLNMWAAISRADDDKNKVTPEFVSASLFPPRSISGYNPNVGQNKVKPKTKRFVFTASKIEEIRKKYADNENSIRPTRIEALSAFIWNRFVVSTNVKLSSPDTFAAIFHLVNLRTRMDPPLPHYSFGNLYGFAMTVPSMVNDGNNCNLVSQIRDSIRKINKDYVKKIQDGGDHLEYIKELAKRPTKGETSFFSVSSLCRFPRYEADFGWGKPIWAGSAARASTNGVIFMDTVSGDGIEAWVNLKDEDMATFERDEELLQYILPR